MSPCQYVIMSVYIHINVDADPVAAPSLAPQFEGVDLSGRTDWRKFDKLDCMDNPGLTEEEFLGLFVKCDACALITTHLMFHKHHCRPQMLHDLRDQG